MRGDKAGMIGKHEALVFQHDGGVFAREVHARAVQAARRAVGVIARVIDHARHEHEKHEAEADVAEQAVRIPAAVTVPVRLYTGKDPVQRPEHAEARPGIETRPLRGRADAERDAAGGEVAQPPLREVPVQKQVHEQDEKCRKAVDRRNARLRQVHEVERQQRRAAQGHAVVAEHPAQQIPHQRQHGHAEERAHEAPAERRHAEEHDAEREDLLAERRVRDFIRIHAAQVLIGRARVVDLIKIRAVVVRGRGGHGVRFVAERVRARRAGDGAHADAAALRVVECELAELHERARRDAHIGRRCGRSVGHFRLKPLEEVGVALRHRAGGREGHAVGRIGEGVFAGRQTGVVPHGGNFTLALEREHGGFPRLERAELLWVARRAEAKERCDGVHRRQNRDAKPAAAARAPGDRAACGQNQMRQQRERERDGGCEQNVPERCHALPLPSPECRMVYIIVQRGGPVQKRIRRRGGST